MADEGTINWVGNSGKKYQYWIYKIGMSFTSAPANYVFARKTEQEKFSAIYIGQTSDISERFDNHEKMPCITRNKATHVCVHKSSESEKVGTPI